MMSLQHIFLSGTPVLNLLERQIPSQNDGEAQEDTMIRKKTYDRNAQ